MSEWKELSTLTKVLYIGGQISFIGPASMILAGMTGTDTVLAPKWDPVRLCPL